MGNIFSACSNKYYVTYFNEFLNYKQIASLVAEGKVWIEILRRHL
jgi:hypothetical protein